MLAWWLRNPWRSFSQIALSTSNFVGLAVAQKGPAMQLPCEASSNQVAPVLRIAMRDISRVESAGPGSERSLFALQTLPSLPDCGHRPSVRNLEESPEYCVSTDCKISVPPLNYLF